MVTFEVHDMTCGHCVNRITAAIRSVDPDAGIRIDLPHHRLEIPSTRSDAAALAQAIRAAGYTPVDTTITSMPPAATAVRAGCCCR